MRFGSFPEWAETLSEGIRSHFDCEQARSCCFNCSGPWSSLCYFSHCPQAPCALANAEYRHVPTPPLFSHMTRYITMQIAEREPLFDQLIANKYKPGEGLKPHVDLMRFQDGIAIVSLQAAATLSFTKGERKVDILLSPGDLLLLEGEARCICPSLLRVHCERCLSAQVGALHTGCLGSAAAVAKVVCVLLPAAASEMQEVLGETARCMVPLE